MYSLLHNFQYFRDEETFPENLFLKYCMMSMGFTVGQSYDGTAGQLNHIAGKLHLHPKPTV